MRFITSLLAILSTADRFSKETKKRNGKAYKGFITFDVNEQKQTLTMTATDGDVHMEEKLALFVVDGSFKFNMHIKQILDILGCIPEKPIEFYTIGNCVCFDVTADIGMLIR